MSDEVSDIRRLARRAIRDKKDPDLLYNEVKRLLAAGVDRTYIYQELTGFLSEELGPVEARKVDEEEVVIDVLSALTGYCAPHRRL